MPIKYKVIISEEVDKFLESINSKAKAKIFYNIHLVSAGKVDKELFKKLEGTDIWSLGPYMAALHTAYYPSLTQMNMR